MNNEINQNNKVNQTNQNNTSSEIKYIEKKGKTINQRTKETIKDDDKEKINIRNVIWVIVIFVIMFSILIALPYISNFK